MARAGALEGRRILVVEDDYFVAESLMEMLEEAGAVVLGPIGWVQDAIVFLQCGPAVDAVLLDVNMHGQASYAVADTLVGRGIPFVFVTGYDEGALDLAYRGYPRCEKPLQSRAVLAALSRPFSAASPAPRSASD